MSTARVLIVDDENGMLRSAERVLGRDYRVVTSRSPVEAIPRAKNLSPILRFWIFGCREWMDSN